MRREREREIEILLKNWIEDCSKNKVWLNYGKDRFKIKGSRKKPDLIIWCDKIKEFVVVEVKTAETTKNFIGSLKIINYWEEYCQNKTKYFVNDEEIKIKSFCIASPYSLIGSLFNNDDVIVKTKQMEFVTCFMYPPFEFQRSKDILRIMWEVWSIYHKIPKKEDFDTTKAGIGIIASKSLYSEDLMKYKITGSPLIFHQIYKKTNKGGLRWMQEVQII